MPDKIREILKERFFIDPSEVDGETSFRDDLGLDSLDLFELLAELEETYGFEIPAEELKGAATVGAFLDCLKRHEVTL